MEVHFINVGYGEAILITRGDFVLLVDGGTNREEEYKNPGCIRIDEYLRNRGIKKIDVVMITHMHDDHIGGINSIIKQFQVSEVWINVKPGVHPRNIADRLKPAAEKNLSGILFINALKSYTEILNMCESRGIPVIEKGSRDGIIPFEDGFCVQILSPDEVIQNQTSEVFDNLFVEKDPEKAQELFYEIDQTGNRTSMSLRISSGKTSVLLTGDKVDGWDELYNQYKESLHSQILKVTHHGQIDGMPESMINLAQPDFFVICTSIDRRFQSAHPEIIERANTYLMKNNKNGNIYITGFLSDDIINNNVYCAVYFKCNEDTGEIDAFLVEK